MRKPILFGIPALVCATSCTPADPPRSAAATPALATVTPARPIRDERVLLSRLALEVPDDLSHGPVAAPLASAAIGAPPFRASFSAPDDADRALECLTAAVYYEARSEAPDGQRAVAQVVLNRVRDRAFPKTVCGVVYQGSTRRTGCQFSFTCDGSMLRPRDWMSWGRAKIVAAAALAGEVYAPVGAATYYHANYVLPWWAPSLARVGSVGSHIFYRWRDAMERALTFRQEYAGGEPVAVPGGNSGTVTTVAGVAIHVGDQASDQVTVHRGSGDMTATAAATPAVAVAAMPTLTSRPASMRPAAPRLMSVAGVRVHRGVDPHAGEDASAGSDETI